MNQENIFLENYAQTILLNNCFINKNTPHIYFNVSKFYRIQTCFFLFSATLRKLNEGKLEQFCLEAISLPSSNNFISSLEKDIKFSCKNWFCCFYIKYTVTKESLKILLLLPRDFFWTEKEFGEVFGMSFILLIRNS